MNGKRVTKPVAWVPEKAALQWVYHCLTTDKSRAVQALVASSTT